MNLGRHEKIAIGITLTILMLGCILGLYTDPTNFSRSGCLITVVGIIFATLDLTDNLYLVDNWIVAQILTVPPTVSATGNDSEEVMKARREQRIKDHEYIKNDYREEIAETKKRLRLIEGAILIIGTLVWGFGDWFVLGIESLARTS